MSEKLLNIKEVSQYLGILENDLRSLVDRGEIPAYRLGGTILRFRKDQIDQLKARGISKIKNFNQETGAQLIDSRLDKWKDFFYFNDFYLISAIVIVVLLIFIFAP